MFTRTLGKSRIQVSAMGLGCWAIGGSFWHDDSVVGYGQVDDAESIRAIHRALDMGVTFFDTSDAYGCGHSEKILGQALKGRRDQVVIATKFGYVPDEATRRVMGEDASPDYIRRACEASLRRLGTDCINLYQFHIHDYDLDKTPGVRDTLEELVQEGKIRFYGWSTIYPERVRIFAEGPHFVAAQFGLNVLIEDPGMVDVCEELDLGCINRGPLVMGILTEKYDADSTFPEDDMRHRWNLREGRLAGFLDQRDAIRDVSTSNGRTLAQGALAWIWARSERTIPIPGFKTVTQVEENAKAMEFGPLNEEQMREIDGILDREPVVGK
jgi:aryl-alcohol dehydrogenase-like predicted oxidoreductase